MKKSNEQKLSDVLKDFSNQPNLKSKLTDKRVEDIWRALYANLSPYTKEVKVKNGVLVLRIESSVLKQELRYHTEKLIAQMNKELGENVIQQIRIL